MPLKPVEQFPAGGIDSFSNPVRMSTNRYLRVRNLLPRPNGEVELRDGYSEVTMASVDTSLPVHSITPFFDLTTGEHSVIFWQGTTPKKLDLSSWEIAILPVFGQAIQSNAKFCYALSGTGHLLAFNGTDKKWYATYGGVSAWRDVGLREPTDDEVADVAITEGVRELKTAEATAVTLTEGAGGNFNNTAKDGMFFYVALFDPAFDEVGPATISVSATGRKKITAGPNRKVTVAVLPDLTTVNAGWVKLIARTEDSQTPAYFCTNTSTAITDASRLSDTAVRIKAIAHGLTTGDVVIQSKVAFIYLDPPLVFTDNPFDGVYQVTVFDADHFDIKVSSTVSAVPGGPGGTVKRIVKVATATLTVDVVDKAIDTSYVVNQDRGIPASAIGGAQPGFDFYISIQNALTTHVGNRKKIGFRLTPQTRTNVHFSNLPDFSKVDGEWVGLIGRTGDGGEVPHVVTKADGTFAQTSSFSIPSLETAGAGANLAIATTIVRPTVLLNGWGNNGHVGDYEHGVSQGHSVPLSVNNDTTQGYTNASLVSDGSDATAATVNLSHTHTYAGCVWKFNGPVSSSASLKVSSQVPGGTGTRLRDAGVWYSLDNGVTWTLLYQSSLRGKQLDVIALPPACDISKIQVMAFTDSHDDMSHAIFEIYVEYGTTGAAWANPNNVSSTAADASVTVTPADPSSKVLRASLFGFALPDQLISGLSLTMEIELVGAGGSFVNATVQAVKAGVLVGSPVAFTVVPGRKDYIIGGSDELFGTSWVSGDLNSVDSGYQLAVTNNAGAAQTFNARNFRTQVHGVSATSVATLVEPIAADTLELPTRNGIPPAFDKIWREGERLCGNTIDSPEVFRSAAESDSTTGDFLGLPEQSWYAKDVETTPTAEVIKSATGFQQESWTHTHTDLAVLSELTGVRDWQGPFPGGGVGQWAWTRGSNGNPYWISPKRQILTVDANGKPVPVSREYEAALLKKIGRPFLKDTEMVSFSLPERRIDILYISARDEQGNPFAIIHDFNMEETNSPYGQGYEFVFGGALGAAHTVAIIKDETGEQQLWAGSATGRLYRLFSGGTDNGVEVLGETIGLKYLGPNREIVKEIQWFGDRKARWYIAKDLNATGVLTDFTSLGNAKPVPEREKDGLWFVEVDLGEMTHCYVWMLLQGHSADGNMDLSDPPHLPLETYGRVLQVAPQMGVARGPR